MGEVGREREREGERRGERGEEEEKRERFSSDCHCSDWPFDT